jgi:small-conductance mechanosensitive channel
MTFKEKLNKGLSEKVFLIFKLIISILSLKYFKISEKKRKIIFIQIFLFFLFIFLKEYLDKNFEEHFYLILISEIIILYISINLIMSFIRVLIISAYKKKHKYKREYTDNLIIGIDRLSLLLSHIIFFIILLKISGINITVFLTTLGIFAVALVLIFKDIITNIIYGLILMFTSEVKLKEYIKIGEFKGRIINMNFLNIEIKTDDGDIVYVPNSKIFNEEIINYSKSSIKKIRYDFNLDFAFFGEVEKLEKKISQALQQEFDGLIVEDNVKIKVNQIASSRVLLTLEITVTKYNFIVEANIIRFISMFILKFIHKEKVRLEKENETKNK